MLKLDILTRTCYVLSVVNGKNKMTECRENIEVKVYYVVI